MAVPPKERVASVTTIPTRPCPPPLLNCLAEHRMPQANFLKSPLISKKWLGVNGEQWREEGAKTDEPLFERVQSFRKTLNKLFPPPPLVKKGGDANWSRDPPPSLFGKIDEDVINKVQSVTTNQHSPQLHRHAQMYQEDKHIVYTNVSNTETSQEQPMTNLRSALEHFSRTETHLSAKNRETRTPAKPPHYSTAPMKSVTTSFPQNENFESQSCLPLSFRPILPRPEKECMETISSNSVSTESRDLTSSRLSSPRDLSQLHQRVPLRNAPPPLKRIVQSATPAAAASRTLETNYDTKSCGGFAYDHECMPKIVAVHSVTMDKNSHTNTANSLIKHSTPTQTVREKATARKGDRPQEHSFHGHVNAQASRSVKAYRSSDTSHDRNSLINFSMPSKRGLVIDGKALDQALSARGSLGAVRSDKDLTMEAAAFRAFREHSANEFARQYVKGLQDVRDSRDPAKTIAARARQRYLKNLSPISNQSQVRSIKERKNTRHELSLNTSNVRSNCNATQRFREEIQSASTCIQRKYSEHEMLEFLCERNSTGQRGTTTAGQRGATTAGQRGTTTAGQRGTTTAGQREATTRSRTEFDHFAAQIRKAAKDQRKDRICHEKISEYEKCTGLHVNRDQVRFSSVNRQIDLLANSHESPKGCQFIRLSPTSGKLFDLSRKSNQFINLSSLSRHNMSSRGREHVDSASNERQQINLSSNNHHHIDFSSKISQNICFSSKANQHAGLASTSKTGEHISLSFADSGQMKFNLQKRSTCKDAKTSCELRTVSSSNEIIHVDGRKSMRTKQVFPSPSSIVDKKTSDPVDDDKRASQTNDKLDDLCKKILQTRERFDQEDIKWKKKILRSLEIVLTKRLRKLERETGQKADIAFPNELDSTHGKTACTMKERKQRATDKVKEQ